MTKELTALAPSTMKIKVCATGAQVLRVDRRLDLVLFVNFPTDVDQQRRIRRVRPHHRSPQVLLSIHLTHRASHVVWGLLPQGSWPWCVPDRVFGLGIRFLLHLDGDASFAK